MGSCARLSSTPARPSMGEELVKLDVEIELAQLRAAEAAAELARLSSSRATELLKSKTISQAEVDSASATQKQAAAQVDNIQAWIDEKTVRAPFAGKLGIRRISVGQYLQKGSPVVSLHSLDPIYVEFSLPQQRVGELAEGLRVLVTSDSYSSRGSALWPRTAFSSSNSPINFKRSARINCLRSRKRPKRDCARF